MAFDLPATRQRLHQEVTALRYGDQPEELYEPIRYLMERGGKRLRPLLTLLACGLFDDDWTRALRPAVGVEAFHNFTLMHDDIMDQAPMRRGVPTVHARWNPNVAILSGDVMLVKAYELLMAVPDPQLRRVLDAFNRCATDVCEGQQHDMNFEAQPQVAEDDYLAMIGQKTASLLGFALELGGVVGGGSDHDQRRLRDLGRLTGVGFQLMDDVLDVYGDQAKFGKQVGGDIIANKKTLLLIRALHRADAPRRAVLDHWLAAPTFNAGEKVAAVRQVYDALHLREEVTALANDYFERGLAALREVSAPEGRKEPLEDFLQQLMRRER